MPYLCLHLTAQLQRANTPPSLSIPIDAVANMADQPPQNRVNEANRKTVAARYNVKVLRSLEALLLKNPEADITTALSSTYSQQLQSFKSSSRSLYIREAPGV